jgi:hypothetical protein
MNKSMLQLFVVGLVMTVPLPLVGLGEDWKVSTRSELRRNERATWSTEAIYSQLERLRESLKESRG